MVIVTHESYDSVFVGTGKQKGLESLSRKRLLAERKRDERAERPDDVRYKTAAVVWMSCRKRG